MTMFLKRLLLLLKRKGAKWDDGLLQPLPSEVQALKMSYAEIKHATHNFSSDLIIYRRFDILVYEGTLRNGVRVAVQRYDHKANKKNNIYHFRAVVDRFRKEVELLFQARHPCIVSLVGYCFDFPEVIIVYGNMARLSPLKDQLYVLKDQLYVEDKIGYAYARQSKLSWEQRLQICIDAAEALLYLHTDTDLAGKVIHGDVNSSTILVDENYRAKLSDFDIPVLDPLSGEEISTEVKGNVGYIDPEFFMTERLTEKSDVYSFGVVLLEVLCARPADWNSGRSGEERYLAMWGRLCRKKGELENIIDPILAGNINFSCLKIFFDTAEKCLSLPGKERPTMREVLQNLELALEFQLEQNGCSSP